MYSISYIIGNLNKEHGGAQQLLFDICRHLPKSQFEITVYHMFGEGTYETEFVQNGATVIDLSASCNYDVGAFYRFVNHLSDDSPDILQTNSPLSGVWGRVAGRLAAVPAIISVEHSVHSKYPRWNRVANGLSLPLADAIVGVSDAVSHSLLSWERCILPGETKVQTIRNGVDVDEIATNFSNTNEYVSELSVSQEDPIIGTVGRFVEAKGYKYLIRAFSEIKREYPSAQLILIGGGKLMPDLKEEARETGYMNDIIFTGFIQNVFPYLPAFDVAAFPSLWEGLPLAPVEAMVAKRPIVATDIPPFQEAVGDAGVLVEPENDSELAQAIISLLENPARQQELGQKGYERAKQRFSIERTAQEYADLYRNLVNE